MQAWCWRKACSCLIHWRNFQELFIHVKKYYPCNAAKDRETYGGQLNKCWPFKLKCLGAEIIYVPNFSNTSTIEISRRNTCIMGIWATCLYTHTCAHMYTHTPESPWNWLFFRKKTIEYRKICCPLPLTRSLPPLLYPKIICGKLKQSEKQSKDTG